MSKPVGGGIPSDYGNYSKPVGKKQPKEGEEGHVKKVSNLGNYLIQDNYIQSHTEAGQKGSLDMTSKPPAPPVFVETKPGGVAKEVLKPVPRTQKSTSNRPPIVNQGELVSNPKFMEMRKKADYEGEIKQSPEAVKAEKEFAEKAKQLGYKFDTEFEIYFSVDKTKEALTKEEMTAVIEGRAIPQALPKAKVYEVRTHELDAFARGLSFNFNEEMEMYIPTNPFSEDPFATIDEMKEMMEIDAAAMTQGYRPIPDSRGIYTNEAGDVKVADDFRSELAASKDEMISLLSNPSLEILPVEIQQHIFFQLYDATKTNAENIHALDLLLVSKLVSRNVSLVKNYWINERDISLKTLGCTTPQEAIKYIIDHKLTSANLSEFPDFNDADLKALSETCPQLTKLSIRSEQISGDQLAEALGKLPLLQSLDLSFCRQIPGDRLAVALGRLPMLQSLDLAFCRQIPGDQLVEVLGKLTLLQSLDLGGCTQISGDQLAEALRKLTTLQSLDLANCWQISGDQFAEALGKLPMLQSLNLCYCEQIPGDQLAEAIGKLTKLEFYMDPDGSCFYPQEKS